MVLILPLAFVLLWLCQSDFYERPLNAWLKSTVLWCSLLYLQTEFFSLFLRLNQTTVFLSWLIVCLCVVYVLYVKKRGMLLEKIKLVFKAVGNMVWHNKFLTAAFCVTGLLALYTVPYNWDSMTYHLPRIFHWAQNQSVGHYGTGILRQISSPPLHEFVALQVYLLSGKNDVFLNLIQFGAFLTNAGILYGLAEKTGCESRFRKISVLLFCAMPIAFGEALTTQNDHFAGMWLLIFTYYLLDFLNRDQKLHDDRKSIVKCVILAVCVGYGYLTKPSVCMGMLFLAFMLLIACIIRKDSFRVMAKLVCIVLPIMIIIVLPEMTRNLITFHAVLDSGTGARQLVGTLNPRYLLINGLKNFSFNIPTILVPQSSRWLVAIISRMASLMKVDINASCISEDGRTFRLGAPGDYGHDTAVNALVIVAAIVCFLWYLYRRFKTGKTKSGVVLEPVVLLQQRYTCIVFLMMIIFCMVVRWEPFVSRYMLPYLALLCPMISIQLQDISKNAKAEIWHTACAPVICCLCIAQLSMLFFYHLDIARRQGDERGEGYFYNRSNLTGEYLESCYFIINEGYGQIGLILGADSYEYPVCSILKDYAERMEHVSVSNVSVMYEDMDYVPDCVLISGGAVDIGMQDMIEVHGETYEKRISYDEIAVYAKCEKQ